MNRFALLLLAAGACAPAKSPTATDVATTAIVLTDDALTVAIAVQPEGFDRAPWRARVELLEQAADAVENSQSLCPHLPAVRAIAEAVACTKCLTAIELAKESLKCP